MDTKDLKGLMEAYSEVYAPQEVDEAITSEKGKAKAAEMIAKRTTASGRAKPGQGDNVATIKHIGRSNRDGLLGTPPNRKVAGSNWPKSYTGIGGTGNKAARRVAALKNEELDIFDVVLEFLQVEGFAETLEEAEWMMANIIDEEAIDIILGEADSIAAMRERAAKRRQQRYGKQGGGGRDDFRPYTKADYEKGEKTKKEEVEYVMEISDRKVKAVRNAREKQWNKQFGKNRAQDPTDDMTDKIDKLIDQRNKRTGSNVKKTTMGQLGDKLRDRGRW